MVRLVDDVLRSHFQQPSGLASAAVTVADPAVGTGTFPLGILGRIAATIEADEGAGAVPDAIDAAIKRLVAFEIQLGPFAVAQLRIFAELSHLIGRPPKSPPRMFVTDTLGSPYIEQEWLPAAFAPIADSRKQASKIKLNEPITVVIGNPPYKEKAKGRGGWIEEESSVSGGDAPLNAWMPPREWGVGAHAKHLRNLYVYFWHWATWKVFDHDPKANTGIVCFITVAGFLNGPGFQRMRDYLRCTADAIWVIDCSPEGHQPEVNTRIFQGVQQPICIVLVSRTSKSKKDTPATVLYHSLPRGTRGEKFAALTNLALDANGWSDCATDWRAPFLPASAGAWATYPALDDLFAYNGSGVMPGRTWVIAPDADSLTRRWAALIAAKPERKEDLFVPHLNKGNLGDRYVNRVVGKGLPGFPDNPKPVANDVGDSPPPVRYAFRSFDH
jgi:predicted helicase